VHYQKAALTNKETAMSALTNYSGLRKKAILGTSGALLLIGGVALAASFTVNQAQSGGGSAVVSTCDATVDSAFGTPVYDAGIPGYVINDVVVTGIASPACDGQTLYVTVADNAGVALGSGSQPINATSETVTLDNPVLLESATDTYAAIQ
jgi:hypothetical protein